MYKLLITIIIATGLLSSCKRNFDEPNPNALTIQNFWVSQNDAVRGVNAIYSTLRRQASVYSRWMFYHRILRADEGFGSGGDGGLNNLMSFVQTDYNHPLTAETWQNLYVGVFRANQAIANIPKINMDEALKRRLIAEAKFMRGLFYFDLTLFWGRPPLMLTPSAPTDQPANATNEEAWAQVIKDFTEAAADLPESYAATPTEIGRATKGAAYAFIGKANLQQNKYQQAVDALNWLVEGPGKTLYGLMPNYRSNFIITSENNMESVFEIQYAFKATENGDDDINETINLNSGASIAKFFGPSGIGFNDGAARKRWLVDTFLLERTATGQRDPRLAASFIFDSADERGANFSMIYGKSFADWGLPSGNMWFRKLLNDSTRTEEGFSSGNNYRMIRYADVLLMYAEALNGIGQTTNAYQYVNRVRNRVGIAPLPPGFSQARFLSQIKHERILELSGEGWRWADLLRWGELSSDLRSRDPEFTNFVKGKHEYYPIPQSDIDLNPNLKQNPGY
ncbi:RagB/SusD family nutrient uptake outer membrane protein [Segetibacter sp. 3557_3]|uniref:RagB/SusD family nutrient uptake outer membrane protein n=1 Tax=Segetibacter sp. 3557_3 TaxID=2547429 RepID=UPI001058EE08|nr:RagB/SusD family nutrient uptake outer membrane protein [Segetibacter sp. 3557_3]TDH19727.1 RagB/SusD family nutrient uptake outer membrane protein [Segetibacter sp. 3557_3]